MPPKNDDNLLLILGKLSEISERTARIETKQEYMQADIETIKVEDARQNVLLAEHIQGTVTNRQRLNLEIKAREDVERAQAELTSRVSKLEEAPKFLEALKKYAKWLTVVAGAVIIILKLIQHL
jgi:DNA-binding transcriptional regulator GbsR (MarR family)